MATGKKGMPGDTQSTETSKSGLPEAGLDARRAKLDEALARHKVEQSSQGRQGQGSSSGWGAAVKISSEFIAGVLVGAGIGYLLDRLAGTQPWGMIIFLMLGFAAGVLNVMRATGRVSDPYKGGAMVQRQNEANGAKRADDEQGD